MNQHYPDKRRDSRGAQWKINSTLLLTLTSLYLRSISPQHGTLEEVPENPHHFIGFFFSFGLGSAGSVALMSAVRTTT